MKMEGNYFGCPSINRVISKSKDGMAPLVTPLKFLFGQGKSMRKKIEERNKGI